MENNSDSLRGEYESTGTRNNRYYHKDITTRSLLRLLRMFGAEMKLKDLFLPNEEKQTNKAEIF